MVFTVGFIKKNNLRINYGGDDLVATFGVYNTTIYSSSLVWGGLLDTGTRPIVIVNRYRFST